MGHITNTYITSDTWFAAYLLSTGWSLVGIQPAEHRADQLAFQLYFDSATPQDIKTLKDIFRRTIQPVLFQYKALRNEMTEFRQDV